MSYVDERFVDEAEHQTIKKRSASPWLKLLPVAACLCILLVGVFSIWDMMPFDAKSESAAGDQESMQEISDGSDTAMGGDPQSWLFVNHHAFLR